MEENLRRNIPSPSTDRDAMAGCGSELAQTNSDSSGLTVDRSNDFYEAHHADARPGTSAMWTDEKHGLYLESLEASFINQLHHSISLRSQEITQGPVLHQEPSANGGCSNSHQFMVLQDGCWQKVNFTRKEPLMESTADSHFMQFNPWIRHFASSGRMHESASHDFLEQNTSTSFGKENRARGNSTLFSELGRNPELYPVCRPSHQIVADNKREVSDQNFVEDQAERSSCFPVSKRLKKTVGADVSNNDQVVPFGKSVSKDGSSGIRPFTGSEKAGLRIAGRKPG